VPDLDGRWEPAAASPAVGGGGRLPRGSLIRLGAAALALALLLGLAKLVIPRLANAYFASGPPGLAVAPGLLAGAAPADSDLQLMAASARVDGDINLGSPSVAEQAAAASLGQGYLYLAIPPGEAPTAGQLTVLAGFMRGHTGGGRAVYLHDDEEGGRVAAAAVMLLLLRGDTWATASARVTPSRLSSLNGGQLAAIGELRRTLAHGRAAGPGPYPSHAGPYTSVREIRW